MDKDDREHLIDQHKRIFIKIYNSKDAAKRGKWHRQLKHIEKQLKKLGVSFINGEYVIKD